LENANKDAGSIRKRIDTENDYIYAQVCAELLAVWGQETP
jgi:hypothetical protein